LEWSSQAFPGLDAEAQSPKRLDIAGRSGSLVHNRLMNATEQSAEASESAARLRRLDLARQAFTQFFAQY
jgi:hypothetical protein